VIYDHAKIIKFDPESLSAKLLGAERVNMAPHMSGTGSRPPLSASDHVKSSLLQVTWCMGHFQLR